MDESQHAAPVENGTKRPMDADAVHEPDAKKAKVDVNVDVDVDAVVPVDKVTETKLPLYTEPKPDARPRGSAVVKAQ